MTGSRSTPSGAHLSGAHLSGRLADLPPLERGLVVCLRMWCTGGAALGDLGRDFLMALGPRDGAVEAERLDRFLRLTLRHARRPLLRHGLGCPCVGADETALARQVALAAAGDHDAALALALDHMAERHAQESLLIAEPLGLAIHRIHFGPMDPTACRTGRAAPLT